MKRILEWQEAERFSCRGRNMGNYDDAVYSYLSDNDRFADLFNVVFFGGREILKGSLLESDAERYIDVSDVAHTNGGGRKNQTNQLKTAGFRDIKKRLKTGASFVVTAVENQNDIDYAMPWRIMRYDQMEYGRQIAELQRKHRREREEQGLPPSRWAERMRKGERLYPVYTICFYHGTQEWDGPRSLKDMMEFPEGTPEGFTESILQEAPWRSCFHDYGMALFCAGEEKDFSGFRTELKLLLEALSSRQDKEKMYELWQREEFSRLDWETAEAIAILTDRLQLLDKLKEYEEGGNCNMCLAMDELEKDWKIEGKTEGIIEISLDLGLSESDILERLQAKLNISMQEAQKYFAMFKKKAFNESMV
ncbi:MAG: Rpn family recombination-promoting nuclease/putative transposase [Muribaculum sp.]|nr:Rpn family recombination-promoting nuclease/putative transposase [Muribaculum sp.]